MVLQIIDLKISIELCFLLITQWNFFSPYPFYYLLQMQLDQLSLFNHPWFCFCHNLALCFFFYWLQYNIGLGHYIFAIGPPYNSQHIPIYQTSKLASRAKPFCIFTVQYKYIRTAFALLLLSKVFQQLKLFFFFSTKWHLTVRPSQRSVAWYMSGLALNGNWFVQSSCFWSVFPVHFPVVMDLHTLTKLTVAAVEFQLIDTLKTHWNLHNQKLTNVYPVTQGSQETEHLQWKM